MDKKVLLQVLEQLVGTSEYEVDDIRSFLQVKQYRELQDPSKFLVVGGRGVGKTRVFKTLTGDKGFQRVIGDGEPFNKPNYKNTTVLVGYSKDDRMLPNQNVLQQFTTEEETSAFWIGSICLKLLTEYADEPEVQAIISEFFDAQTAELLGKKPFWKSPSKWIRLIQDNPEPWENFLDEVDRVLEEHDRWVILAYDQIDRISTNYDILYAYIRALVSYWFSVSTRWSRLKCKIFIRTDLRESESIRFPDSSKLSSRQINLNWNTLTLYRLLIRRLANLDSEAMIGYLSEVPGLIAETKDMGYLPTESEEIMREFIRKMIGRYMGSSPKKGESYLWIPNHLQDANGDLAPRSFLKCYSFAAQTMLKPGTEKTILQLQGDALLTPSSIQGAVQEVSADRVKELKEDFPWIVKLKGVLEGGTLLMSEEDFRKRLQMFLKKETKENLPADTVDGLENLLSSLGIVQHSTDGRINMPEIYLHGFGLKRKGGLRRPN